MKPEIRKPMFSNSVYNAFRDITQYWLPGLGTLYFTLASIWGFPYAEQVIGTLAAIAIFLGLALGVSNSSYKKSDAKFDGEIAVDEIDPRQVVVDVDVLPEDLQNKKEITLKVQRGTTTGHDWSSR